MNLTTPFEVLKYSPAGFSYPTRSFCFLIPQIEQAFKRECLGDKLFDFLVSRLKPYPANFEEWDAAATYSTGDIAIRNLCTYESTANANTTDPLAPGSSWALFQRFDHAGANELWESYLRQILASKVYVATLPSATYQTGAGGLVVNNGDSTGARAASKSELLGIINEQTDFVRMTVENMLEWLADNAAAKGLPYAGCSTGCETRATRSRRFAFRV
jgi:hypothetical protein